MVDAVLLVPGIVAFFVLALVFLWCVFLRDKKEARVPVAPAPEPEPPPPPPAPVAPPAPPPEEMLLFFSDIQAFNVPDADLKRGSGDSDPFVVFQLLNENKDEPPLGESRTAVIQNKVDPVWHSRPMIQPPLGFKKGWLKVTVWDDDVNKEDDKLGVLYIPVEMEDLPKKHIKLELEGQELNGEKLDNFTMDFNVSCMSKEEAHKLKVKAGAALRAAKALQEAEKAAKAKQAARDKAAREKAEAERLAREKAEMERLAAELAAAEEAERERLAAELAAAEAAAAEAAAAAAARALAEAEFTLIVGGIKAHKVPDADKKPGDMSKAEKVDPYVRFTVLDVEDKSAYGLMGRTEPMFNTTSPVFKHGVQVFLPAGSKAAMAKFKGEPVNIKVELYDKDLTDEDDRLGQAVFTLDAETGSFSTSTLSGACGFADSAVTFDYKFTKDISPPAVLTLKNMSATGVPSGVDVKSTKSKKETDPYLKFVLLEVGDYLAEAATPTKWNTPAPKWDETFKIELPRASSRPPLLYIKLWDDDLKADDDALAQTDLRLAGDGTATAELPLIKGLVKKKGPKAVTVKFDFTIETEEGC